jgi:recombinational DNA repair protein (RecF pathway)
MVKVCVETAINNESFLIGNLVLYFEIWLLRLGGYMPNLNVCGNCKRSLFENEGGNLQYNFQVFCRNCDTSKAKDILTAAERDILNLSQKQTPKTFVEMTEEKIEAVNSLSKKFKSLITNIIGKKITSEKTQTAAP